VQLTRAGYTLGTPYYMPPEQVLGKPLTPQADVYAFGILLYELLTGVRPVMGGSVDQIFQAILTDPLDMAPLKSLKLPTALNLLIERCTAKQAERRPAGLGEVCAELQQILQTGPPKASGNALPKLMEELVEKLPKSLRTQTGLICLGCSAVVVVMALLLGILKLARAI
jgi:serine/threonine protein kinase